MPNFATSGWPFRLYLQEAPGGFPEVPSLTGLHAFWLEKRGDRRLPARADFPVEELRPWLGHVSLVDVTPAPRRFRWRLVGTGIAEQLGRDATGRWFDDLYEGEILDGYVRAYTKAVERRQPVFHNGDLEFVGKDFQHFKSVHLPLSDDGTDVNMLMLGLSFDGS
ncbi:PAS domain-containing protein [Thalassobaculum sp.]|uniref:PAS domain-containing protein n=1 Tax=Thalassobaculum sp. TaxID=2022740 RepID=UPI0032EC6050